MVEATVAIACETNQKGLKMSLDNQTTLDESNVDHPPKKSGGLLKWILILGLLAMVGCIVGFVWFAAAKGNAVKREARSFIEGSTVVKQNLGSPVTISGESVVRNADGSLDFGFDVTGPEGDGKVTVNAILDQQTFDFVLGDSSLEFNGETFDLNAVDEFSLDVEGMDEE